MTEYITDLTKMRIFEQKHRRLQSKEEQDRQNAIEKSLKRRDQRVEEMKDIKRRQTLSVKIHKFMISEFEKSRNRDFKNPSDVTVHDQGGHICENHHSHPTNEDEKKYRSPKSKGDKQSSSVPLCIKLEEQRKQRLNTAQTSSRRKLSPNVKHFSGLSKRKSDHIEKIKLKEMKNNDLAITLSQKR